MTLQATPPQPANARPGDAEAGIVVTAAFEPFAQRNDIFSRAMWDPVVATDRAAAFFASYRMRFDPRRGEGFGQRDFALRNAAWVVSDIISERSAEDGRREGFQSAIIDDTPIAPQR
ncbi:MAG: reductive dehalogenase, partial [Pseudomonadota bacterium]